MKRIRNYKKYVQNEKGISLFIVLMVLVVVSIMGISLMGMAASNVKMNSSNREYQSTYYIAEAGANYVLANIKGELEELYQKVKNENPKKSDSEKKAIFIQSARVLLTKYKSVDYSDFSDTFGKKSPIATITIKELKENEYLLTSIGEIGNTSRAIETTFEVGWTPIKNPTSPIFNKRAVYSDSCIKLEGSASIIGDVGINGNGSSVCKGESAITLSGSGNISGHIYINRDSQNKEITLNNNISIPNPEPIITDPVDYKEMFPQFPTFPKLDKHPTIISNQNKTLNLDKSVYIPSITVLSSTNLNIDVGNTDKVIVVDDLNITSGRVNIIGTGKLSIYVKNNITMDFDSTINNNGDINKLAIYLKGSGNPSSPKSVTLEGAQQIFGSLFAEDANIDFTRGSGFHGHIYTGGKSFVIGGGNYTNSKMIFAPNADFQLLNGAIIKGSVIAKSFYASGGSSITFENTYDDNIGLPLPEGDKDEEAISSTEPISIINPIREK